MMKSGLDFFYFEIPLALSKIPAINCQVYSAFVSRFFLHSAAATLKVLVQFQKKNLEHFLPSFLSQKYWIILWVLGGVIYVNYVKKNRQVPIYCCKIQRLIKHFQNKWFSLTKKITSVKTLIYGNRNKIQKNLNWNHSMYSCCRVWTAQQWPEIYI